MILWKTIRGLVQYSLNKDQQLKWQQPKVMGIISWLLDCDWQATDAVICLNPGKNGRFSQIVFKFQNRSVQTFGFVYHDTNGQNHGPVMKDPVVLLERKCVMVILWQDCYGKGNLRKSYWNMTGRKFQIGNVSLYHREKGLFLSVYVDDIKLAGKKHNNDPMWKVLNKEVWFGRTNIFPGSCILGMHSTSMWNKQRYCGQLQNHVRIREFPRVE